MSLRQFIYSLGSRSSAPGGGSASAAIGAMVSICSGHHKEIKSLSGVSGISCKLVILLVL